MHLDRFGTCPADFPQKEGTTEGSCPQRFTRLDTLIRRVDGYWSSGECCIINVVPFIRLKYPGLHSFEVNSSTHSPVCPRIPFLSTTRPRTFVCCVSVFSRTLSFFKRPDHGVFLQSFSPSHIADRSLTTSASSAPCLRPDRFSHLSDSPLPLSLPELRQCFSETL